MAAKLDVQRFKDPLYTVDEAARIIEVPRNTLSSWARRYERCERGSRVVSSEPLVTRLPPERPRHPSIPFVGLAEAMVLAAVRRSGVPMQRIRPALTAVEKEMGLRHALANRRLYTDGAELLYDYSQRHPDKEGAAALSLVVIRNRQYVFTKVVAEYLRCLVYDTAPDGYVRLMRLPAYRQAEVVVDPARSCGDPIFARGGCRVRDVMQRFWAGDSLKRLTREFGAPKVHLEDALRVASRRSAPAL